MRFLFHSIMVALLGATAMPLTSVDLAQSQDPTPSRDPAIYKSQLREAVALGRKTLRAIEALPVDETIPNDPKVLHDARSTCIFIRAARHGMNSQRERQNYRDPMLELAFKRVDQAGDLTRMTVACRSLPRVDCLALAVRILTLALRLLDQALIVLPSAAS